MKFLEIGSRLIFSAAMILSLLALSSLSRAQDLQTGVDQSISVQLDNDFVDVLNKLAVYHEFVQNTLLLNLENSKKLLEVKSKEFLDIVGVSCKDRELLKLEEQLKLSEADLQNISDFNDNPVCIGLFGEQAARVCHYNSIEEIKSVISEIEKLTVKQLYSVLNADMFFYRLQEVLTLKEKFQKTMDVNPTLSCQPNDSSLYSSFISFSDNKDLDIVVLKLIPLQSVESIIHENLRKNQKLFDSLHLDTARQDYYIIVYTTLPLEVSREKIDGVKFRLIRSDRETKKVEWLTPRGSWSEIVNIQLKSLPQAEDVFRKLTIDWDNQLSSIEPTIAYEFDSRFYRWIPSKELIKIESEKLSAIDVNLSELYEAGYFDQFKVLNLIR